jgi:hypothetical protein
MSVSNRVTVNFDTDKFGDIITISDANRNFLNLNPTKVTTWQKDDLANNAVSRDDYFFNPVGANVSSLSTNVTSIIAIVNNDRSNVFPTIPTEVAGLSAAANGLFNEITCFTEHTNRMSGVTGPTTISNVFYPDQSLVLSTTSAAFDIVAGSEDVTDKSIVMGAFTSLFVNDEISSNARILGSDYANIVSSIVGVVSTMNAGDITAINVHINTANTLLNQRRTADYNHYLNCKSLQTDYSFLNGIKNSVSAGKSLMVNLTGTQKLKDILANT